MRTGVVVIGTGPRGLGTARELKRRGLDDVIARIGLPRPVDGPATRVRRDGAIPVVDSGFVDAIRDGRTVGHLGVLDHRGLPLVHGSHVSAPAPGLRFVGFTNPISGNLREMRLDARRIARAAAREHAAAARVKREPLGRAARPAVVAGCCGVQARP